MKKLMKYTVAVFFSLGILIPHRVRAAEITAVDFNGNIIGQVISTGMVINPDGENIGSVTADSLILDGKDEIIGGVVPQGVAIGNDNKLLGKIYNDGKVRSVGGKDVGQALPNGLVLDNSGDIIGAILYPGIVYSAEGTAVGRVNGAGMYTNLEGQEVGFVSANGIAYKRAGNEYVIDGHLMSSKMIVSLTGEFIGSIAPTGEVINFEGKAIGNIHANGFAYGKNNEIIGRIVQTGYAFNLAGNYIGYVSYNGEVYDKGNLIGKYRADGNIVNDKEEVIGFFVGMAATANDNSGHYLGRVMPFGMVVRGTQIVGRVGAKKFIYDENNVKIGEIVVTGPVFDAYGQLKGQSLHNGKVISLRGSVIGFMRGRYAYDGNGTLLGGTIDNLLAYSGKNEPFGVADIDAAIRSGADTQKISPFGYMFDSDGKVSGNSVEMAPVYSLEGFIYSYLTPNGVLYKNVTGVQINQSGSITNRDGYIGGFVNSLYHMNSAGQSLGMQTQINLLLDKKGEIAYKEIPGGYVIDSPQKVTNAIGPIKGFSGNKMIALNTGGDLLGYTDSQGRLLNLDGQDSGYIITNEYVADNDNVVAGKLVPFAPVVNDKCSTIGVVNGRGDIINNRDVIVGRILPNGQAISDVGSYIGYATFNKGLIDFDGNYVGTLGVGKGVSADGKPLGCVLRQGIIVDADKKIKYGVIETEPVMGFNNEIIGNIMANGTVADSKNQIIGYVQPTGNVVSKSKKALGQIMKYKVAFDLNNKFLGMVQHDGRVITQKGEVAGQVNFDGSVVQNDDLVGYALYDFYMYDENFVTYGYLTKDGVVLSMVGSKLGNLDRGFMVDRAGNVVARGNRDYIVRDINNSAVGELHIDGNVTDTSGQIIGYLSDAGAVRNSEGAEIAQATPFQYYVAVSESTVSTPASQKGTQVGQKTTRKQDWIDRQKVDIVDAPTSETPDKKTARGRDYKKQDLSNKIVGIALDPDGDVIGNIYADDSVRDAGGTLLGYRTPDGMIVDTNYNPIGIEEVKTASISEMFVPENAFGKGNAYGVGSEPTNLGPGGGYGQGERYDPIRRQALGQLHAQRRATGTNLSKLVSATNIKPSSFTGYEDDNWPGQQRQISTWRVDMSEMILEDKPIPAVLARSVYGSDSGGFSDGIPITAIVERNVYSEEGRNIIIPAGSRVIGELGGDMGGGVSGGAVKMQITWKRLIRPDGSQFKFNGAQTADAQGRAGALAYLDEQLLKRYTMPIVASALESGLAYVMATGKNTTSSNGTTTSDARSQASEDARQNFIDQMNTIFEDIMQRKSQIQSVTYMPAGTRIIIFPKEDLWLNSEERSKESSDSASNPAGDDGLVTEEDAPSGNGGNVTYNGNYQENVRPATAPRGNYPVQRQAATPQQSQQQARPQPTGTPASTDSNTGGRNNNNEVPDLI